MSRQPGADALSPTRPLSGAETPRKTLRTVLNFSAATHSRESGIRKEEDQRAKVEAKERGREKWREG